MKHPTDSANYRPIALASSASKIIEKFLYDRLMTRTGVSDNQFGFKRSNSTDQCILALKKTVNYYHWMNTPVFACFIEIKSAFDRVNQGKLFEKLIKRDIKTYLLLLLRSLYSSQRLFVEWGTARSRASTCPMDYGRDRS